MPFIIIDQGGPAIRDYHPPNKSGVSPISASNPTTATNSETQITAPHQTYQEVEKRGPKKVAIAGDIMNTRVISLDINDATLTTAKALLDDKHIKHLPITKNGKLYGMTCESDILRHLVSSAHFPKWIVTKVFAATAAMDIRQLAHVMFDEHISSLPIINSEHQLIGIVTRSDLLRVTSHYGPLEFWA